MKWFKKNKQEDNFRQEATSSLSKAEFALRLEKLKKKNRQDNVKKKIVAETSVWLRLKRFWSDFPIRLINDFRRVRWIKMVPLLKRFSIVILFVVTTALMYFMLDKLLVVLMHELKVI